MPYERLEEYYYTHYNLEDYDYEEFKDLLSENPFLVSKRFVRYEGEYMSPQEHHLRRWFKSITNYQLRLHSSGRYGYVRIKRGKYTGKWIWR